MAVLEATRIKLGQTGQTVAHGGIVPTAMNLAVLPAVVVAIARQSGRRTTALLSSRCQGCII